MLACAFSLAQYTPKIPSAAPADADLFVASYRAVSTLAVGIDSDDTSITVQAGHGALFAVNNLVIVESEVMLVTNIATDTLTVTRAQQGTSAASHAADIQIYNLTHPAYHNNVASEVKATGQWFVDHWNETTGTLTVDAITSGDGTAAGEVILNELSASGSNYISLLAPDAITNTLRLQFPNADPSDTVLSCAVPSANLSACSWVVLPANTTATSNEFFTAYNSTTGAFTTAQPAVTDLSGLGSGMATFLATPSSANLRAALTDESGTGAALFAGGALGTPASATLTNATGLPVATGISGLGTGVATVLGTPSSANLAAALTDETGSGAAVFGTSPTIETPTIASFANATHGHTNAAGGGQLTDSAFADGAISAAKLASNLRVSTLGITIDGGGEAITTGTKGYAVVPFACTIQSWSVVADQSGSIVLDVWKHTAVPTNSNTITASAKPTLSAAQLAVAQAATGWTTAVSANDVLGFEVESAATVTRATLTIACQR
jgi:hypothetical protein